MKKLKETRSGILCLECGWVGISWWTHDCKVCSCINETMIDGGSSYLRCGGLDPKKTQIISISPAPTKRKK